MDGDGYRGKDTRPHTCLSQFHNERCQFCQTGFCHPEAWLGEVVDVPLVAVNVFGNLIQVASTNQDERLPRRGLATKDIIFKKSINHRVGAEPRGE